MCIYMCSMQHEVDRIKDVNRNTCMASRHSIIVFLHLSIHLPVAWYIHLYFNVKNMYIVHILKQTTSLVCLCGVRVWVFCNSCKIRQWDLGSTGMSWEFLHCFVCVLYYTAYITITHQGKSSMKVVHCNDRVLESMS